MRSSDYLLATLKETPADAEAISHQLMLRAGLIRKLASGLYTWLPTGVRVLRKVETIVREELNRVGAIELLMPMVQPAELWQESGRLEQYGPELAKLNDRHDRTFVLGPTHEEVITDMVRNQISSYKQLPINFYQIQTKFRDEIRPRFGVMRAREFVMKDAYSFHLSEQCLDKTYWLMHQAYTRIFARIGLECRPVAADTGSIGGALSHEFHVLADTGEDAIAFSNESEFAANVEMAEAVAPQTPRPEASQPLQEVATPEAKTIEAVSQQLNIDPQQSVKTLIVHGIATDEQSQPLVALILRGDHSLNEIKAQKLDLVHSPLTFASEAEILAQIGSLPGSLGPVNLNMPIIVDRSACVLADFVCGANKDGYHFTGVNFDRDICNYQVEDIRNVVEGDLSPCGQGQIEIKRGIEVGHIFQLGQKYAKALNAGVLDESGKHEHLNMGCYGIGISRVVAAAIEQNHDKFGIKWPEAIAPFQVVLIPMNMHKSHRVTEVAETLYQQLLGIGVEVLFDDRKERPGVMFNDAELIGIPHAIIIGERNLDEQMVEYKHRITGDKAKLPVDEVLSFLQGKLS